MNTITSKHGTRSAATAFLLLSGQAERRRMGNTVTDFLATGESTGGKFCIIDEIAEQGETVPLHKHDADDETFYVLEGELSIALGDGPPVRAPKGSFAHVPGGTVHGFRVESTRARYLILTTPNHGEFYKAIADLPQIEGAPPETAVASGRVAAACKAYGVDFVAPFPGST